MLTFLAVVFSWSRAHTRAIGVVVLLGLSFVGGRYSVSDSSPVALSVSYPVAHVTTIKVPVPVLTPTVVKEYVKVEDRTQVNQLLAENKSLKVTVEALSVTHAEAVSTGTGVATIEPIGVPDHIDPPLPPFHLLYKDWRLQFESNDSHVSYTLSQKFSIVNTVGKNKNGVETHLVRLFEIGPDSARNLIPTVETTTVVADITAAHWYAKPTIQAGIGLVQAGVQQVSGIVAIPVVKRGHSRATEDTRWAVLTPAIAISATERTVGLLPVSYNLGTLPRQPFTNLWVSPFVGKTATSATRLGFVVTATF